MTTTMQRLGRMLVLPFALALLAGLPLGAQAHDTPMPISVTEGGSQVVSVTAGFHHTCALQAGGAVACWGNDGSGQVDPAAGNQATGTNAGPHVSVTAGFAHTCALQAGGAVACWGNDNGGQVDPAAGNQTTGTHAGPYVLVSAGGYHTCALQAGGAVACWGNNDGGQVNPAAGSQSTGTHAGPYISVSAGWYHTCALQAGGAVDCWGSDFYDQVNPDVGNQATGTHAGPYVSVSAGWFHTCALQVGGAVDCWGDDGDGQVNPAAGSQPTGTHAGPYVSVSAGSGHTCAVKAGGAVECWGDDGNGQVDPAAGSQPTGTHAGPYVLVSAGAFHTCALQADGAMLCWGAGEPGTSGSRNFGQSTLPADLGPLAFGQIAAGNAHACELKRDGTLACWGDNSNGQTIAPADQFTQVVAGDAQSCAIRASGGIVCWGFNSATMNILLPYVDTKAWRQMSLSPNRKLCALGVTSASNPDWCFQFGAAIYDTPFGLRNITHDRPTTGPVNLNRCGVRLDGTGYCASGFDAAHQGDFAGPWQRLESGLAHQCGLKTNGSIECWGDDLTDGQLDNAPAGTEKFRTLSTGYNHACAIRDNGQLYCWGSNVNGQATPPAGTYVQVAAGNTFTCAIRSDGVRVCWGASPGNPASLSDLADGTVGVAYSQQIAISGPLAPDNPVFVHMSGTLPPGLTLSSIGLIDGTPTTGGTYSFVVDAEGDGAFAASRQYTLFIDEDSTPPTISYTLNGEAPLPVTPNDWYTTNVDVAWTVADPESGIASSVGCTPSTLTGDAIGASATCSAINGVGLETKVDTESVNIDVTKPTISVSQSPASPNGSTDWYTSDVTVSFSCDDATSGIYSCPASQTLSSDGTSVSSTEQTATDKAGNVSDASNIITVKIDKTAPMLNPILPSPILRGQSYTANPNASDDTSGIASSSCGALDTSTLGNKSTTCTAADVAGNTHTVTLHYTVTTTCVNDGYKSTQLTWCKNICENGLTGATLDSWIHRWVNKYRDLPYCQLAPQQQPQ